MAENSVKLNPALLEELLNSPDGPVGIVIDELSERATVIARTLAPVLSRKYQPKWMYGPPGATKSSVRKSGFRFNSLGQMYSGVNVNLGPTLFLQYPASQYHGSNRWMFMSHALDALNL